MRPEDVLTTWAPRTPITTAMQLAAYHADVRRVREVEGKNRSPIIDAFNRLVGVPVGSPYCASGLSACFRVAELRDTNGVRWPQSAGSQFIRGWFERTNRLSWDVRSLKRWRGAVGGWTLEGGSRGHIFGIVGRMTNPRGKIVALSTIEYNTGLDGDRDGEGCFRLVRVLRDDGLWRVRDADGRTVGTGRKLWFCDTSDLRGGRWWNG